MMSIRRWVMAGLAGGLLIGLNVPAQDLIEPMDLVEIYLAVREMYLPIAPPEDEIYRQDLRGAMIYTFDPKTFDGDFLERLTGIQADGVVYYRVTLAEDPDTRERRVYNDQGELMWRIAAPSGYRPDLETPIRGDIFPLGAADPARIRIVVTLMERADKEWLDEQAAENALGEGLVQAFRGEMELDGFLWYEEHPPADLTILAVTAVSNQVVLTLGYPDTFTNRLEIFNFDSGDAPEHEQLAGTNNFWSLLATNISVSGTSVTWTNSSIPTGLYRRFYVAGNADCDSDGDRLADAREIYLYHTSTSTNDTDGDGIGDFTEVLVDKTDPNNGDTTPPLISLIAPSADDFDVWVP